MELQSGDQVVVQLVVEYYRQRKKMSCWYAAAKMLYSHRHPDDDFEAFLQKKEAGKQLYALYEKGLDASEGGKSLEGNLENWSMLTAAIGMQEVKPLPRDTRELAFLLRTGGPLWCAGNYFPGGSEIAGHIIVAVGVAKRPGKLRSLDYVICHDPAPQKFLTQNDTAMYGLKPSHWFFRQLYDPHITNGESPMMYLPK